MAKGKPWTNEELTTLHRAHAEGKSNAEIHTLIPTRGPKAIDSMMEYIGLARHRTEARKSWSVSTHQPLTDPWVIKVKFEDITPTEARLISGEAPRSGRYRRTYSYYSMTGNSGEMCAR